MFMVLLAIILRGENTLIAHMIVLIILYMSLSLQSYILIVLLSHLLPLLVTIMREEERLIFRENLIIGRPTVGISTDVIWIVDNGIYG